MLLLLPGLCCDATDARLLGRLPLASREPDGMPKESRLTPDSVKPLTDEAFEAPDARFLVLRTVTVFGMWWPSALPLRGLARGGVLVGAGSFDRAEYTRSSSFCILPISPRIWYKEPDLGRLGAGFVPPTLGLDPFCAGAVVRMEGVARPVVPLFVDIGMLGPRECRGCRDV
jgi:hypothetical protein